MNTNGTTLVERARLFATFAHHGQLRKYGGEPYINHPRRVAALVTGRTTEPNIIAAAWLHDVIEDCGVKREWLEAEFGYDVASIVWDLTDRYTPEAYPETKRKERKEREACRLAQASRAARLIKRCDIADNTADIVAEGGSFAAVYLAEKVYLLERLDEADALWSDGPPATVVNTSPEDYIVGEVGGYAQWLEFGSMADPDGTYTCTCPSWVFQRGLDDNSHCKHIRRYLDEQVFPDLIPS